tara:strand:- start:73 stop:300 length:228 start_codon:yes stop_codon:yes gene_type:complete
MRDDKRDWGRRAAAPPAATEVFINDLRLIFLAMICSYIIGYWPSDLNNLNAGIFAHSKPGPFHFTSNDSWPPLSK